MLECKTKKLNQNMKIRSPL